MRQWQRTVMRGLVMTCMAAIAVWLCSITTTARPPSLQQTVFNQVWATVNEEFFDPQFNGVDWQAARDLYAPLAAKTRTSEELAAVINPMLAELKTSHTHFYTAAEPEYYQIAGIFKGSIESKLKPFLPDGKLQYTGIGLYTQQLPDKRLVRAVLDGSPAAQAGLQAGDELLSVDGQPFQPITSFASKAGRSVSVQIRRAGDAEPRAIAVTPRVFDPTTMFVEAMQRSIEVISTNGKRIGYVHVWSYADDRYQQLLESELTTGQLRTIDGLVWDLRDGWGGARPTYLNFLTAPSPTVTFIPRDGRSRLNSSRWQKPIVMLINQGSRSGKEILAYGFRKYNIGKLVGTQTAGAVVGGRAFVMPDGSLLYLAVVDVRVDGERLEGKGVQPDIAVPFNLESAQGRDPQKERAIATVLQAINP